MLLLTMGCCELVTSAVCVCAHARVCTQVSFPLELDMYAYCDDALKEQLAGPRVAYKEAQASHRTRCHTYKQAYFLSTHTRERMKTGRRI